MSDHGPDQFLRQMRELAAMILHENSPGGSLARMFGILDADLSRGGLMPADWSDGRDQDGSSILQETFGSHTVLLPVGSGNSGPGWIGKEVSGDDDRPEQPQRGGRDGDGGV